MDKVPVSFAVATNQFSRLRACMVCSIVRTESKFRNEGCPNCEEYLEISSRDSGVEICTSQAFEGTVTVNDPKSSWVARWLRLDSYIPGVYAVKVSGELSEDVISEMEALGIKYVPRDGSEMQEST